MTQHDDKNDDRTPTEFGEGSVGWTEAQTIRLATEAEPFELELGGSLGPVDVEYETYGKLSARKNNVVLIVHALSGDAHVAGHDKNAEAAGRLWRLKRPGWWDAVIGPGKPIDTNRWHVICPNVLGSCYGTTGPSSLNPVTGKPYGLDFPKVTVGDWVQLQAKLLDTLGINILRAVVGGSLGGQQAIEWALAFPGRVERCIVLAASPRLSTQGLAFNAVGRHCILNDPNFRDGDYYDGDPPSTGLSAARMLGHITYLSDKSMYEKFGRRVRDSGRRECGFGIEFEVENYLEHQARSFVERFDANSYLYITRAMDYYDAAARADGDLIASCAGIKSKLLIVSYSSDWLYPAGECRRLAEAVSTNGKSVTYVNIPSKYGHDAFLVETEPVGDLMRSFISAGNGPQSIDDTPAPNGKTLNGSGRWQDAVIDREIPPGASVLDLGCGEGELLARLMRGKRVAGQGVEIDTTAVFSCVARGVPVMQADLDDGLRWFPDASFDYVVLEETLQTVRRPVNLLDEMLRIGKFGIISFPNFANYRVIYDLMSKGRMPVGNKLPYHWYETPNIHLFTIRDFMDWAHKNLVVVEKGYVLADGRVREIAPGDNMYAEEALLIVRRIHVHEPEYCI